MAKSILQKEKECYLCGSISQLHKHHIFEGSNRKNSEKYGFWVYLCAGHHNMSNFGVHFDKSLDLKLKQECQCEYEKTHTRAEFMCIIGKNYME